MVFACASRSRRASAVLWGDYARRVCLQRSRLRLAHCSVRHHVKAWFVSRPDAPSLTVQHMNLRGYPCLSPRLTVLFSGWVKERLRAQRTWGVGARERASRGVWLARACHPSLGRTSLAGGGTDSDRYRRGRNSRRAPCPALFRLRLARDAAHGPSHLRQPDLTFTTPQVVYVSALPEVVTKSEVT